MSQQNSSPASLDALKKSDLYVLFVMEDTAQRQALERTFVNSGFTSHAADSGLYALTMLERNPIDVVVIAKEAVDMSGLDFYEIVVSDTNLRRVLVVLLDETAQNIAADSTTALALAEHAADTLVLENTIGKLQDLGRLGRQSSTADAPDASQAAAPSDERGGAGKVMTGKLEMFFSLVDLILLLTSKKVTGKLKIATKTPAIIFFYKGDLFHAIANEQIGEDALIQIFYEVDTHGNVPYQFEPSTMISNIDDKRSIKISVEKLLFQVTVELDYRRKGNA